MIKPLGKFLSASIHFLFWMLILGIGLLILLLGWLAYGIPGSWIQQYLDNALPADQGKISMGWVAYRPGQGLVVNDLVWKDAQTHRTLLRVPEMKVKLSLLNFEPFSQRIKTIEINDPYVAQIVYSNSFVDPRDRYQPRPEPFDFSSLDITFAPIDVIIRNGSILDVPIGTLTATCEAKGDAVYVTDVRVEGQKNEILVGHATVLFEERYIDFHLSGTTHHTNLNGVYRALNFPLIETYNNQFHLNTPSYGDANIRIGLDKYENIFDLDVRSSILASGDYCGIPFDEASAHIVAHGIWDTRTEIKDIVVRREGDVIATGGLKFDLPANTFSFHADATGLSPVACYQLINMPFTEVLPPIFCTKKPTVSISGVLPLLTPQLPSTIVLNKSSFKSNGPCSLYGEYHLEDVEMSFSMQNGRFNISDIVIKTGENAKEIVNGSLEISIPDIDQYVDIYGDFKTKKVSLKNISKKFVEKLGEDATCMGSGEVYCRTDATFLSTLWANFDVHVHGKKLTRFNIFSVITDFLANNIPGIKSITDSNDFYAKGTIRNGVVDIERARLEGSLLSIEGPVQYNLVSEEIKASLIVGVFNEDSYMGMATRTFLLPIATVMWQVHLSGPIDDPKWELQTIVGTMRDFLIGRKARSQQLKDEASKVLNDRSRHEDAHESGAFTDLFFGEE